MADTREGRRVVPRSLEFAQFAIGLLWLLAARSGASSAAQGIARVLHAEGLQPLLEQLFLLVLLVTGYTALHWVATRNGSIRETNGLPLRATTAREWQKGAAIGWALLLITLIPMAVVGDLHPQFWFAGKAWAEALLALLTLFFGALATEMAFRGYLLQRLVNATGPISATFLLALVYAYMTTAPFSNTPYSFAVAFISGVLFATAYLRTLGLWLGWGIRFGWLASMGVLFGLPLAGSADFASVVSTDSTGRLWLTGGAYGPEGAVFTGLVLLGGVLALFPLTKEYAWSYGQPELIPGGYPVEPRPPAAHAQMEAAAAGTQLVQIGGLAGSTPGQSPLPVVSEAEREPTGRSDAPQL